MTVLITGGLGHIGSKLIRFLPANLRLTVVDNLLTQRYCSLLDLERPIKFLEKDVSELKDSDLEGIDVVVHFAAITNAAASFKNTEEIEKVNIDTTKYIIDLACKANCKFIFPSSTSVYGVAADVVFEDDDKFLNPQSPYAESKIEIEKYLESSGLDYLILRFGTIFGYSSGIRFHTAINKFCYEASLNNPLTVWEQNYEQYRPYLGLNDACRSVAHFLDRPELFNETYNILTDNYKLKDIVEIIRKHIDIQLNMVDTPLLNQHTYMVSAEKAKLAGFVAEDDIDIEIKSTLNRLKNLTL